MGITDTQYKTIYDAVEDAMQASGLLEKPLNTKQKRNELYNATTHLYTQFHSIFTDLTDADKERYIQAVAQRCNHNKKRRIEHKHAEPSPSKHSQKSLEDPIAGLTADGTTEKWQRVVETFGATIIYVKRFPDTGVSTCVRLRDLLPEGKSMDNISVDKLVFSTFEDTLKQDVGFKKDYDVLMYVFRSGDRQKVTSERIWKTIIDHAFTLSLNFINFTIEQNHLSTL
jgi:hypothetical protein